MRGKNIMWITLIGLLIMSTTLVSVTFAPPNPTIAVDPASLMANPGDSFAVNITIANAVGVNAWEFKLVHGSNLRLFKALEGDFLIDIDNPTYFEFRREPGYTIVGCIITEELTASGSGILATMQYICDVPGDIVLDLCDTQLLDINGDLLTHGSTDGYWYSTIPAALFSVSPGQHEEHAHWHAGDTLTFDASASYDPDGGAIASYEWDFGDDTTDTGMVVTHAYTAGHYTVSLTVTDDEPETYTGTGDMPVSGAPVAEFVCSPYVSEVGETLTFDAAGTVDVCGTIAILTWNFGDGSPEVEHHFPHIELTTTHEYSTGGMKTVTLTVSDFDDNEFSVTEYVVVGIYYEADLIMKRIDPSRRPSMPGPVTFVGKCKSDDASEMSVYAKCVFIIMTETGEEITLETATTSLAPGDESPELSVDWNPEEPGKYFGTAYGHYAPVDGSIGPTAEKTRTFSFEVKP